VVWETRKEAGAGQVTVYLPGELAWLSEVEEVIGEGPREEWVLDQPLYGLGYGRLSIAGVPLSGARKTRRRRALDEVTIRSPPKSFRRFLRSPSPRFAPCALA
jgi:hypothetical protein